MCMRALASKSELILHPSESTKAYGHTVIRISRSRLTGRESTICRPAERIGAASDVATGPRITSRYEPNTGDGRCGVRRGGGTASANA
jgi:hypothetical protein